MNTWARPPAVTIRFRLCGTTRRIAIARRPSRVGRRAGRETGCAGAGVEELMDVCWRKLAALTLQSPTASRFRGRDSFQSPDKEVGGPFQGSPTTAPSLG